MRQPVQALDLQSADFKRHPEITWEKLISQGPVITSKLPLLGRIALTTHYEASQQVLRNTADFSVDGRSCGHKQAAGMRWWVPPVFRPLANNLLTVDGPEHRSLRQRVDFAFRKSQLAALQPSIDKLVEEHVDNLLQVIQKHGQADFVSHVARPLPQQVISQLLGLGEQGTALNSPLAKALAGLGNIHRAVDLFRAVPAIRLISKILKAEIANRRQQPQEDLLSLLVADAGEGRALSDDELLAMVFILYVAGHETTTHLLSTSLLQILSDNDIQEQITAPLANQSINEFMRFLSPVQMTKPRFVLHDMDFHGATLLKGDTIAVLIGAANRDEQAFPDANRFILSRASSKHIGFGTGAHACLGLHLALSETATVLNRLIFSSPQLALAKSSDSTVWSRRLGLRALVRLNVISYH